jgi:hypothetical protein
MPIVEQNRLKGNYGAAYLTSVLSSQCLVRPVAVDTDLGVDLYCETVEEGSPFLHFWMQVKTGRKQCRLQQEGTYASSSFDVDHLKYWCQQPVPVYAALVPVDWPISKQPYVYIVKLSDKLIDCKQLRGKTVTLRSDLVWAPNDRNAVRSFLRDTVPESTARMSCKQGVVASAPTLHPEYEKRVPAVPVSRFSAEILHQIRRTAAFSIIFMYHQNDLRDENKYFRQKVASILETFSSDQHWENFFALALSSHSDKDYERASGLYQRAMDCIHGDTQVASKKAWQKEIQKIDELMQKANRKEPLRRS